MTGGLLLVLSGGVGGAKLALGLARVVDGERLVIVANTGDDFVHLGLYVSPDLDSITYALAGVVNPETGWGRAEETWSFLAALAELGGDSWFRLGDKDLAVHVLRTLRLAQGATLSEVAAQLAGALGVKARVVPMSDDPVRTIVLTERGELSFQDYLVRLRAEPVVTGFRYEGAARARVGPALLRALSDPELAGVVVCPSNPYVSIGPILAVPGVEQRLRALRVPLVAVSPIVGGEAVKGPAAKMMRELGVPASALEIARSYSARGILGGFVLDRADAALEAEVARLGVRTLVTRTVMRSLEDKIALAREVVDFALDIGRGR
jgi:LPPG:FO 2-phospho-L-lactate transferase